MENTSNQVSELKKEDFGRFENFLWKIMVFWCKNEKKTLLILFVPKWPKTCSRHNLPLFLWYQAIKTAKTAFLAFFGIFWHFLVVFGVPPLPQNLSGWERVNFHFFDWIWLFTYKTIFWSHKITMLNGKTHPKVKNQIFWKKISSQKCRFLILAKNPETKTTLLY